MRSTYCCGVYCFETREPTLKYENISLLPITMINIDLDSYQLYKTAMLIFKQIAGIAQLGEHQTEDLKVTFCQILTNDAPVPLSIPDPPDAKLTPVVGGVAPINDRYGGDVGNPIFFAAKTRR
ncbi:hypothetical protein Tco_1363901 [Tanacetum coccineum]